METNTYIPSKPKKLNPNNSFSVTRKNMNSTGNFMSTNINNPTPNINDYRIIKRNEDFNMFHKMDKRAVFGYDTEKLQDIICKLKTELNKKNKEYNTMRVELNIIQNEDKKKLKIIEDILTESGKSLEDILNIVQGNEGLAENNSRLKHNVDISAKSLIKAREIYIISHLKNQVHELKQLLEEKSQIIDELKSNSKVIKYSHLEADLKLKTNECILLKDQLDQMIQIIDEKDKKITSQQNEHENLYNAYLKKERESEKLYSSMVKLEEDNRLILVERKKAEENANRSRIELINYKNTYRSKEELYNNSKLERNEISKLQDENSNISKQLANSNRENLRLKNEIKSDFFI